MSSDFWINAPTVGNNAILRIDPISAVFVELVTACVIDVAHEGLFRFYADTVDNLVLRHDFFLMILVAINRCLVYLSCESKTTSRLLVLELVVT